MDLKLIKQESKNALEGIWLMFFLVLFVNFILLGALGAIGIGIVIEPVLLGGLYLISKDIIKHKKIDVNLLVHFFKDLNQALKLIGVYLLYIIIVVIGLILFIIPGVIFALQYAQALFIMSEHPELGIWDAMNKSQELMNGHQIELFVFYLSFIGHFLLLILTLGIYGIYLMPYIKIASVNYFLHLTDYK